MHRNTIANALADGVCRKIMSGMCLERLLIAIDDVTPMDLAKETSTTYAGTIEKMRWSALMHRVGSQLSYQIWQLSSEFTWIVKQVGTCWRIVGPQTLWMNGSSPRPPKSTFEVEMCRKGSMVWAPSYLRGGACKGKHAK